MAVVKLRNDWFAPDGELYKKGRTEVPDALLSAVPRTAEVVDTPDKPGNTLPPVAETLRDHDHARAVADAEAKAAEEAEANRRANAERMAKQLREERAKK